MQRFGKKCRLMNIEIVNEKLKKKYMLVILRIVCTFVSQKTDAFLISA